MTETLRPASYPQAWNVPFKPTSAPPADPYSGAGTTHLSAGTVLIEGGKPLPCDVIWEHDVPLALRDGVVIYTDILRPATEDENLPAIISWSSYGKALPTLAPSGVLPENFSGLGKFEGADAAFWVDEGYVVVNPDIRGAGASGGDIQYWGSVDAHDGYDVVEWVAEQPWSNGKVALYGASWLAIAQWGIAATKPPHLAAIAPWNGIYDVFRTDMVWGGIPNPGFFDMLTMMPGTHAIEAIGTMAVREPLMNEYWEDKTPDLSDVTVPAYVVVDGVTGFHSMGGPEAFRRLGSTDKWLRFNDTHEWIDQYTDYYQQDVRRFFDRYLKGLENGWEQTPRVRATVLNAGGEDFVDRPFSAWPPSETRYQQLYLDAQTSSLSPLPPAKESAASYRGVDGEVTFTTTFEQATTLVGYMSVQLWVEVQDADDMDLFIIVEKLDQNGELLVPHRDIADTYPESPPGAPGRLRASLRELDADLSTGFLPVHTFREPKKLSPGEIVRINIGLTPRPYHFEAGQQLRLTIAGWPVRAGGVDVDSAAEEWGVRAARAAATRPHARNHGTHVIHTSTRYDSHLSIPIIEVAQPQ